jgi:hypothetical protein
VRSAAADRRAAEEWFRDQGLPWFVDAVDDRVRELVGRRRIWPLLAGVAAVSAGAGWLTWRAAEDVATTLLLAVLAALALLFAYAGGPLRVAVIARWAFRRVITEMGLLLPLVTRALPLLLLFMTFLFVNTEVWQVASALPRSSLYGVVLLFSGVGVAFLLTRLPEEVGEVQRAAAGAAVARACQGTPLEERARALALTRGEDTAEQQDPLTRTQQANLLLVLLVTQALQVLLLAFAVFAFFIGFGLLAIRRSVIEAWIGQPPTEIVWDWRILPPFHLPVSGELYQVSVFLSAFAGLYFTVYAVSDATYRQQFFAGLSRGLERAIGVREVYRALLRHDGAVEGSAPRPADDAPVGTDSVADQGH